jgi:molybdate/tungstate transport system substrate-binding protein
LPALSPSGRARLCVLCGLVLVLAGCPRGDPPRIVTVFHAASLARVLDELEERYEAKHPGVDIRLEPSGSQIAARKVSELNRPADLVLTADWRIIEEVLFPEHADWLIRFTSNEIVLAHGEHSPRTEDVNAKNWPGILLAPDVRLGRANEDTAPLGFHTLLVWKLAELQETGTHAFKDLAERLKAKCLPEHVTPDITELASLLEARTIDYAFLFRSIAEEHNLKTVRLPAEINLASSKRAAGYARVTVPVRMRSTQAPVPVTGSPILYGVTVPRNAPNRPEALRVVAFLLGPQGKRLLERSGFTPLVPPDSPQNDKLPPSLRQLVGPP